MEGEGDSPIETVVYVCSVCEKNFKQKKNVYKHLRSYHNIEPLGKKEPLGKNEPQFECEMCEKKFSRNDNLKQHAEKFHGPLLQDQEFKRNTRIICSFEECDLKFMNHIQYRIHLQTDHKLIMETEEFCFGSIQEFQHWKKDMESQSLAFYTQDTAKQTLANGNIKVYYNCHRSLKYISKGKNKRAAKSMGSNKINKACPARLDVEMVKDKSKVIVKFYKTHCGHEIHIGRIRLDKITRAQIADQLKDGVAFDDILDSVRDSYLDNGTLERISLLTRKDLRNIARDFSINVSMDDSTSQRHHDKTELHTDKAAGGSEVVRTKWKGLKDSYKKFQIQAEPTGQSGQSVKCTPYHEWSEKVQILENLGYGPSSKYKISSTSLHDCSLDSELLPDEPEIVFVESSETLSKDTVPQLGYSTTARTIPAIEPTPPSDPLYMRRSSTTKRSYNKSADDGDRPQLKRAKCGEPSEAIDNLFKSYAETFKRFTAKKQGLLKLTLAELFAEAELDEMSPPSVVSSSESVADEQDYSLGLDLETLKDSPDSDISSKKRMIRNGNRSLRSGRPYL